MQERLLQTAVFILYMLAFIIFPYLIGRLIHPFIRKYVTEAGSENPRILIWMIGFVTIGITTIVIVWCQWILYGSI
jgi:MFS family permease